MIVTLRSRETRKKRARRREGKRGSRNVLVNAPCNRVVGEYAEKETLLPVVVGTNWHICMSNFVGEYTLHTQGKNLVRRLGDIDLISAETDQVATFTTIV